MAKKKKKVELSSEGKTELAKAIAEKSQNFAKTYARIEILVSRFFRWLRHRNFSQPFLSLVKRLVGSFVV